MLTLSFYYIRIYEKSGKNNIFVLINIFYPLIKFILVHSRNIF